MWQKTQMVTDQKSIFLQFSCIENIISVLKDSVWLIDVLIERRKSLGNFSHTPGDGPSWHLGILVFPGLFYFVPKFNEHKAKPWSTFYDFSWPKLIIFSIVEKVGKYPFYCPRNHKNNELLDLEPRKQLLAKFLWELWSSVYQWKSEFLRRKAGSAPQITSGKLPTVLTPVWLLAPSSSDLPCGGERTLTHPDFPGKTGTAVIKCHLKSRR